MEDPLPDWGSRETEEVGGEWIGQRDLGEASLWGSVVEVINGYASRGEIAV